MPEYDYEDLVQSLANSESRGFQRFADAFGPRFRALFLQHGLSVSDAEDLAANCVTDIALKIPGQYRPGRRGGFQRWVFVLARRAMVDWYRMKPPTPVGPAMEAIEFDTDRDLRHDFDVLEALDEAIEQLPAVERKVVELRDLGTRYEYTEIGQRLGIPSGTARVYHHRALARLRKTLETDPRIQTLLRTETSCRSSD